MRAGHVAKCDPNFSHKGVEVYFFKRIDYPHSFCELCLYDLQIKNGTLPKSAYSSSNGNTLSYINHLTKSKPESDSL